ncbi:MAG: zf-HC2 domain-containing protein [Candidatus Polarisedimenticolia bacterium]
MKCEEILARLDAWTDGDLDAAAHADVQRHLDGCPACREALLERDPLQMFAGLATEARPAEAWDGFWEGIRDGIRGDELAARRRRPVGWRTAASVAAALVLLVAAFFLMGRPEQKTPHLPMVAAAGLPAPAGSPRPQTVEQVLTSDSRPVQIFSMAYEPGAAGAGADAPTELVLIVDAGLEL